ncbi:hypothetical protein IWX58_003015 [Rubrivivax gelatinosus]|nr:hypothetical protein [Rubrivivax gelatinosus]MBG6081328.1 hypothetical protein [Rubrivivax gelatinosus]
MATRVLQLAAHDGRQVAGPRGVRPDVAEAVDRLIHAALVAVAQRAAIAPAQTVEVAPDDRPVQGRELEDRRRSLADQHVGHRHERQQRERRRLGDVHVGQAAPGFQPAALRGVLVAGPGQQVRLDQHVDVGQFGRPAARQAFDRAGIEGRRVQHRRPRRVQAGGAQVESLDVAAALEQRIQLGEADVDETSLGIQALQFGGAEGAFAEAHRETRQRRVVVAGLDADAVVQQRGARRRRQPVEVAALVAEDDPVGRLVAVPGQRGVAVADDLAAVAGSGELRPRGRQQRVGGVGVQQEAAGDAAPAQLVGDREVLRQVVEAGAVENDIHGSARPRRAHLRGVTLCNLRKSSVPASRNPIA